VLVVVGVRGLLDRSMQEAGRAARAGSLAWAYESVVGLTLANPLTIFSFAAGLRGRRGARWRRSSRADGRGLDGLGDRWALLTGGVALARRRLGTRSFRLLRAGSGGLLAAFGLVAGLAALVAR
jgi:hypothetical protein